MFILIKTDSSVAVTLLYQRYVYYESTSAFMSKLSPCYEENDPQRLPGDGKQEQSDGRAEGDEGAAEKHRGRHVGSSRREKKVSGGQQRDLTAPRLSP